MLVLRDNISKTNPRAPRGKQVMGSCAPCADIDATASPDWRYRPLRRNELGTDFKTFCDHRGNPTIQRERD